MAIHCTNRGPHPDRNCQGARHVPPCLIYLDAVGDFVPQRKLPKSGKHRTDPTTGKRLPPLSKEERNKVQAQNAKLGGRPPGVENLFAPGTLKLLRQSGYGIKKEIIDRAKEGDPEALAIIDAAGMSNIQLMKVIAGKGLRPKVMPSVVKGIGKMRELYYEPVVNVQVNKNIDLGKALDAAEGKTTPPAAPAETKEKP